ncbi:MAG: hypothetical protein QME12_02795 [Nanoarchaeota archaeon]|nr:hypothetical protein [Nanoarchaeota archaeon]
MVKSGPCTLVHTERRGGCEIILLCEGGEFNGGSGKWVDGDCDTRPEIVPELVDWEYDYYPCDERNMVRP